MPSGYYQKLLNELPTMAFAVNQFATGEAQSAALRALVAAFRESAMDSAGGVNGMVPGFSAEELAMYAPLPLPPIPQSVKKTPYRQAMNSEHKGLFVFLVDQSQTMEQPFAGDSESMHWRVTRAINDWIYNLGIRVTGGSGGKEWIDVAVIGYRTDKNGVGIVESMLGGEFRSRGPVPIAELAKTPLKLEGVVRRIDDEETQEQFEVAVDLPSWIDSVPCGDRPTCSALGYTMMFVSDWIASHPDSFPPVVIHLTSGDATDGEVQAFADYLREAKTTDGNVLLFNCLLISAPTEDSISSDADWLCRSSSRVPPCLRTPLFEAESVGLAVAGDQDSLASFMEIADLTRRDQITKPKRAPSPDDEFELSLDAYEPEDDPHLDLFCSEELEIAGNDSIELGDGSDVVRLPEDSGIDLGDGSDVVRR